MKFCSTSGVQGMSPSVTEYDGMSPCRTNACRSNVAPIRLSYVHTCAPARPSTANTHSTDRHTSAGLEFDGVPAKRLLLRSAGVLGRGAAGPTAATIFRLACSSCPRPLRLRGRCISCYIGDPAQNIDVDKQISSSSESAIECSGPNLEGSVRGKERL